MGRKYSLFDIIVTIYIVIIGAAEAANLYGIALRCPLSKCDRVLYGVVAIGSVALIALSVIIWHRNKDSYISKEYTAKSYVLLGLFLTVVVSQVLFLILGTKVYRTGDMTVEAVKSFLQTDGIYRVNPLTGREYTAGIPSRIKILCLPTFYAVLCEAFGFNPQLLVWKVIPVVTLVFCYTAFICVAKALFAESVDKQLTFMIFVAVLMWIGSYMFAMDGFGLLFSGWRGVTIRNLVLVPYAVSLSLRKKYLHALLCALAEACVLWTFYGLGVCVVVIAGICIAQCAISYKNRKREATK